MADAFLEAFLLPAAGLHCSLVQAPWHLVSTSWFPLGSSSGALSLAGALVLFKFFVFFELDLVLALRRAALGVVSSWSRLWRSSS